MILEYGCNPSLRIVSDGLHPSYKHPRSKPDNIDINRVGEYHVFFSVNKRIHTTTPKNSNTMTTKSPSEFASASLIRRLASMLYDSLILIAIWMIVTAIYLFIYARLHAGAAPEPVNARILQLTLFPLLFVTTTAFYAFFWRNGGQTLGMRAWRIYVVSDDANKLTLKQCAIRCAVALVSGACLGLGYLTMLINSNRQTWHEAASRTRTIYVPKNQTLN
jgi:uncharacterized RDD family membrane protein YckC